MYNVYCVNQPKPEKKPGDAGLDTEESLQQQDSGE